MTELCLTCNDRVHREWSMGEWVWVHDRWYAHPVVVRP